MDTCMSKTVFAAAQMATLECRHTVLYSPVPKTGDTLYCRRCCDWKLCILVDSERRMECHTHGCNRAYPFGTDEGRARRMGISHLRKYPDHDVWLYRGNVPVERIAREDQPPLPIVTES